MSIVVDMVKDIFRKVLEIIEELKGVVVEVVKVIKWDVEKLVEKVGLKDVKLGNLD